MAAAHSEVQTLISHPTDAEDAFDRCIYGDSTNAKKAQVELIQSLTQRGILFGGSLLPTSLKPLFVPARLQQQWTSAIGSLLALAEGIVRDHLGDPAFYDYLGLPLQARGLVEIDPGYDRLAVVCRPDALYNYDRVAILEVNADSPAMMTCADHVEAIQRRLYPMAELASSFDMGGRTQRTPALLRALVDSYHAWGGKRSHPTIAIVDWADEATLEEQKLTATIFAELGCPTLVCDPRELTIQRGALYAQGRSIDIVQRRILFPDFVHRTAELGTLIVAYRERLACLVNPLRSFLLGHKGTMAWLKNSSAMSFTTHDHALISTVVPPTRVLASTSRDLIAAEQSRWVLKPTDGHGGHNVIIGAGISPEGWREAVDHAGANWIIQEFRKPVRYSLPLFGGDADPISSSYYINWNPFFFGGAFGGAIARASKSPVVNIRAGGALLPVIAVD